jgi:hypothetical protein
MKISQFPSWNGHCLLLKKKHFKANPADADRRDTSTAAAKRPPAGGAASGRKM